MEKKKYYLAYGSNLNIRQMRYRCPGAKPIGITAIPDYELLYKGSKTGAFQPQMFCTFSGLLFYPKRVNM